MGDDTILALLHTAFAACPGTCEGNLDESVEIAAKAVRLAESSDDRGLRALVMTYPSYLHWLRGDFAKTVEMCDTIIELTEDGPAIPFAELIADPRIWAMTARTPCLLALGHPEEARRGIEQALALAEEGGEEMLGWAHMFAATFHPNGGDMDVAELVGHTRAAVEIAERLGDAFSQSWARYWRAYATLHEGDPEAAIEDFERALMEIYDRGSGRESESLIRSGIGAALVALGRIDEGIEAGREAVRIARRQGARLGELWASESLAEWLLQRGDDQEAAIHLQAAHDLAQDFGHVIFLDRIALLRERLAARA